MANVRAKRETNLVTIMALFFLEKIITSGFDDERLTRENISLHQRIDEMKIQYLSQLLTFLFPNDISVIDVVPMDLTGFLAVAISQAC